MTETERLLADLVNQAGKLDITGKNLAYLILLSLDQTTLIRVHCKVRSMMAEMSRR